MTPEARIEDLLAHASWVRRLAFHLTRDRDLADSAVQDTWLAAVRSPPSARRPPRPWLAEVLRNFVRKGARRTRRCMADPMDVAGGTAAASPSSEVLLANAQIQRVVAEAVLALDEPYRTTVLLRYYQDTPPSEIAAAAGIPAGTVRWRLNEAMRRLRRELDARRGGELADWRFTLLPIGGSTKHQFVQRGLLLMGTKAKIAFAAGVLGLVIAGRTTVSRLDRRSGTTAARIEATNLLGASAPAPERSDPRSRESVEQVRLTAASLALENARLKGEIDVLRARLGSPENRTAEKAKEKKPAGAAIKLLTVEEKEFVQDAHKAVRTSQADALRKYCPELTRDNPNISNDQLVDRALEKLFGEFVKIKNESGDEGLQEYARRFQTGRPPDNAPLADRLVWQLGREEEKLRNELEKSLSPERASEIGSKLYSTGTLALFHDRYIR